MSLTLCSYRNLIHNYCRRLNVNQFSKLDNTRGFTISRNVKSEPNSSSNNPAARRCLSGQSNPDAKVERFHPPLMESKQLIWPEFLRMLKCWFIFQLKVMPLEAEFDFANFMDGTKHAICTVSDALSREDYESLEGMVTPQAIEILKENISRMNDKEKKEIPLKENEAFFAFPWDVKVLNVGGKSSRSVEVMMVHHFLRNWKDQDIFSKITDDDSGFQKFEIMRAIVNDPDYVKHVIVANYRFAREFGNGDSSWHINFANQFRINDVQTS